MKPYFLLLCLLLMGMVGCSRLDSKPIDVQIIGSGKLEQTNDSLYVELGSNRYYVNVVFTGERHPKTNKHIIIKPQKDMMITCFRARTFRYEQFIVGVNNSQQIEAIFKENYTVALIFFCFSLAVVIISLWDVLFPPKHQSKYFID